MSIQSFVYPKPDNEILFETLCRKVFSLHLKLPHLQKFARRGQEQFGVDLISNAAERIVGVQCKLKNARAVLDAGEVDAEIQRAKNFAPPLDEYIIATTADREPALQQHAIRITQEHKAADLFGVVIYAWQDLEEILKENPDLANEIYAFNTAPISAAYPAAYTAITSFQAVAGTSHAEIDEAARHLTEGRPDVSLALLEKIKKEKWEILGHREKFRVVANIGNAFYNKGDHEKAALAYFEAAAYQPRDDSDALSIAAHAYLLTGDREQAYRMASESCLQSPVNERGNLIRIASAPTSLPYEDLLTAIPEILRSNPNIALALHYRSMEANNPNEAEKILRPLKDLSPTLHFALGTALLQQGLPTGVRERMLFVTRDPDRLHEARDHFAVAMSSPDASPELVAAARYNRSLASMLLKDDNEAFVDIRSAYDKEPENEEFGVALIAEALRREDKVSGLPVARDLVTRNLKPGTRFMVSVALHGWGDDNEKREEFVLLKDGLVKLPGEPEELRLEYIRRVIYLAHLYGELTDGLTEELVEQGESALEQSVIRSWAWFRMSRRDDARAEALRAATCLGEDASYTEKHEVALILTRLGLAEQALPIWLEICPPQEFSEDTLHLLGSAEALDRDDVIIGYCRDLRSNGIYAPEIAGKEIEVLEEYNELREAKVVICQYLDANSDDLSLRLLLLHLAVIRGWSEIVDAYMKGRPDQQVIKTVTDGARLVQILGSQGKVMAAVEDAYQLVRRFPNEPLSHRALITSILGGPGGDLRLEPPPEVTIGSAVQILRERAQTPEWIVIEDSENPEISRGEYPPTHPLSKALLGAKVGDSVAIQVFAGRSESIVVREVKNKILFRMHESMEQMNQRFPDDSFFVSVPIIIPDGDSASGHELDELIDFNRKLAQAPQEAERLYGERRAPVSLLAATAHREIPEVVGTLARSEMLVIHCVDGRPEEFQHAYSALGTTSEIVLDLAALSTIDLLGPDFDLSRIAATCIVSEGSLESLKKLGSSLAEDGRLQGYMRSEGDRLVIQEINPEIERERAARAVTFASRIEASCEIVGGRSLARLDSEARGVLKRVLGVETAESLAIAKERNCPLWTDDYVTGVLAISEFSLRRVWAQVVCFWLRDAKSMSGEECDAVSARLCGFNYRFTSISPSTILVACGMCEWNPDVQPLRGVLDRFGEHRVKQDLLVITASVLPSIWRDAPIVESASRVTIRMLDKLSQDSEGISVIQTVLRQLDNLFGINVIRAQEARTVFEAWLRTAAKGGIIGV
jgi:tetratricopeptide (TPR) repeat protein